MQLSAEPSATVENQQTTTAIPPKGHLTTTHCVKCKAVLLKQNLARHMKRKHGRDFSFQSPFQALLVDSKNAIYMVRNSSKRGRFKPTHVQELVSSSNQILRCELQKCEAIRAAAARGNRGVQKCAHLKAIVNAKKADCVNLEQDGLEQLVKEGIIKEESATAMRKVNQDAKAKGVPVCVEWKHSSTWSSFSVVSTKNWAATLNRVGLFLVHDTGDLYCRCSVRRGCVHKKIVWWYLIQTDSSFFRAMHLAPDENESEELLEMDITTEDLSFDEGAMKICRYDVTLVGNRRPSLRGKRLSPDFDDCPSCCAPKEDLELKLVTSLARLYDITDVTFGKYIILKFVARCNVCI